MRAFVLGLILLFSNQFLNAQIYNPVSWQTKVVDNEDGTYDLQMMATIDKGWHLYSQELPSDDGPIATEFTFPEGESYELIGNVKEPKPVTEYDPNFDMDLNFFKKSVTFTQKIKSRTPKSFDLTAEVYFMVCDEEKCLPPEFVDLNFSIPASGTVVEEMPDKIESTEPKTTTEKDKLNEAEQQDEKLAESKLSLNQETEETTANEDPTANAIRWTYAAEKLSEGIYEVKFKAILGDGWHLYSQHLPSDEGPIATAFYYDEQQYELEGETEEKGDLISDFDPNFEMDLNFYANEVTFVQKIKTTENIVQAEFEYMICDEKMCLPPELIEVEFNLSEGTGINVLEKADQEATLDVSGVIPALPKVDLENPVSDCGEDQESEEGGLMTIFFLGVIGGLIALLTPCVFPMIPLTVSFFTKGDGEGKGVGKAVLYGFFIFAIYAVLSIPFHFNTDPEVLNEIATSVWLNIILFVVFVVFAISFFGSFEITLPSS